MILNKDEIVSIEEIGEAETGDVHILDAEGEHQQNYFLGNGINVHNSGAMNQYPSYKFGKAKQAKSLHEIIDKWTEDTYGLIIYQEQVMQIVRELGGFDWAQTNTVRKVMSKSGGAEFFMKTFWPTWKKNCAKHGLDEKVAKKAFHRIMSFGSWAFNKSFSSDTLILNTNPNQFAPKWITVKQLHEQEGYATNKWRKQPKSYVKMNTLSMDSDGKLRPAKIKDVFCHGNMKLYEIITESGKKIKITDNHRLLAVEDGEEVFVIGKEIVKGTILVMNSGYEEKLYEKTGEGKGWNKGRKWKNNSQPMKDGRSLEVFEFKDKMRGKSCQRCGREWYPEARFEVHHTTRNPPHSKLRWLCNSCHKIEDYELGNRKKQWNKGYPVHYEKVISKKYVGIEEVYDIEMEDASRPTFVANGFVSHNSHSVSYAMVSYICMWFKVKYPLEFMTAYLNIVKDSKGDKKQAMIKECERLKVPLREPNVNVSEEKFVIHGDAIVCGLRDIKNVGEKAVKNIVENQPYKGLWNFLKKVNNRQVNKRVVEHLIMAGAFDDFGYNKKKLLDNLVDIMKAFKGKSQRSKDKLKQLLRDSKGGKDYGAQTLAEMKMKVSPIAIGKHIVRYYDDVINQLGDHIEITNLSDIEIDDGDTQKTRRRKGIWIRGLLTQVDLKRLSQEVKEVIDQTQEKRYALANLVDDTDFIVLSFRDSVYEQYEQKLFDMKGKVLLIQGEVNVGWKKVYVNRVWLMSDLREVYQKKRKGGFYDKYLFQHPMYRYFGKKLKRIRDDYNCVPLKEVVLDEGSIYNRWVIGLITDIQTKTIKKEEYRGQEMYIITFEDESFQGSFILYPSDKRFKAMKKSLFKLYEDKRPFMMRVQRDYRFKPSDSEYKQVCLSIDKRVSWKSSHKTPFKFKGEKNETKKS